MDLGFRVCVCVYYNFVRLFLVSVDVLLSRIWYTSFVTLSRYPKTNSEYTQYVVLLWNVTVLS